MTPAQLSLLDAPVTRGGVRKSDPISSVGGARTVDAAGQATRIRSLLAVHPEGLTRQEIADETRIPKDEVSSRLSSMKGKGVDTRGFRDNAKGRPVLVWVWRNAVDVEVTGERL